MSDTAIVAIVSIVLFVVLTWIAAALLTIRDRSFPRKPRLKAGPPYPPKWARGRWTSRLVCIVVVPWLYASLTIVAVILLILARPVDAWNLVKSLADPRRATIDDG